MRVSRFVIAAISGTVTVEVPWAGADLGKLPGVASIRTHVVSEWFTEGGAWRLNALGPGERGELMSGSRRVGERRGRTAISATDRAILSALAVDGRTPMRTLAEIAGHILDRAVRKVTTVPPEVWLPGGDAGGSGA
ncbi:AsnC family protein [Rhodococcus sp. Chr-9]|uniref:AsnC family protein n=1 Tax=Rhodococcus sp. Chr-9 TaxID=713612 RepID=UPI00190F2FD1|nr:AsnC family protein [Rhodococcus sp. Chr-9]